MIDSLLSCFLGGKKLGAVSKEVLEKLFSSVDARAYFSQELFRGLAERGFPEMSLDRQQFETLSLIFHELTLDSRINSDVRSSRFIPAVLSCFYTINQTTEKPLYLYVDFSPSPPPYLFFSS